MTNAVRDLREAAGLSQAELARRSGVAQPNIAAYEAGRRGPGPEMLDRLRMAVRPLPHDALAAHGGEGSAFDNDPGRGTGGTANGDFAERSRATCRRVDY